MAANEITFMNVETYVWGSSLKFAVGRRKMGCGFILLVKWLMICHVLDDGVLQSETKLCRIVTFYLQLHQKIFML